LKKFDKALNTKQDVPAAGIRIGKFDIQGNYTIAGDNQWVSARVAYFWEK